MFYVFVVGIIVVISAAIISFSRWAMHRSEEISGFYDENQGRTVDDTLPHLNEMHGQHISGM
jgi:hypothetical protein